MTKVEQKSVENRGHTYLRTQFESGNKILTVNIDLTTGDANTFVNTLAFPSKRGATTQVYAEARDLIQTTVNRLGRPILYELCTLSPSMIMWAMDHNKGAGIFNWDYIDPKYHRYFLRATKMFYPVEV